MVHIQKIQFLSFRKWLFGKNYYTDIFILSIVTREKSLEIRPLKSSLNNRLLKYVFHDTSQCVLLAVRLGITGHGPSERWTKSGCKSDSTKIGSLWIAAPPKALSYHLCTAEPTLLAKNVCTFEGINSHFPWKFCFAAFSTKKKKKSWVNSEPFFHCQLFLWNLKYHLLRFLKIFLFMMLLLLCPITAVRCELLTCWKRLMDHSAPYLGSVPVFGSFVGLHLNREKSWLGENNEQFPSEGSRSTTSQDIRNELKKDKEQRQKRL